MHSNSTGDDQRLIKLYKREGSADKVYQLSLQAGAAPGTFDVLFQNARRGQPLKVAKSLPGLTREAAVGEFDRQLKAKLKDGYTEEEHGQAYTSSAFAGRDSGLRPQLPKVATEAMLPQLLADPLWGMQEKANGENRIVQMDAQRAVRGTNKRGLWVDIPQAWVEALQAAATDPLILCGEHVDEKLYVFDALMLGGKDIRHMLFRERYTLLMHMLATWNIPDLVLLQADFHPAAKAARLDELRQGNREGAVFKLADQPYQDGYSDASLKFKFNESSACHVLSVNKQRSVQIGLLDAAGALVPVGSVTVPVNQDVPEVGSVVEVRYLYLNHGGAFEQPVFLFKRNDMEAGECRLSQVTRYKPDAAVEAVERPRMRG